MKTWFPPKHYIRVWWNADLGKFIGVSILNGLKMIDAAPSEAELISKFQRSLGIKNEN